MASRSDAEEVATDEDYEEVYNEDEHDDVEEGDDEEEQQEQPASTSQAQEAQQPRGLPGLPARPAAPKGLAALPPRGLPGGLPPRDAPQTTSSGAASSSSAPAAQPQTAAAATPAGLPSLPARPAGLPGLPARAGLGLSTPAASGAGPTAQAPQPQAAAPAATSTPAAAPQQPASSAAPAARPMLPPRQGMGAASSGPSLPSRPGMGAPAAGGAPRPAGMGSGFLSRGPAPPTAVATAAAAAAPVAAPAVPAAANEVVDPSEDKKAQRIQKRVQELRTNLIRAAGRLGLRYDSDQVTNYLQVVERVERLAGASGVYKGTRRVDLNKAAEREARQLDSSQPADSRLDIKLKIMVIGMTGTGKSELINAMLERPVAKTNAFKDTTKSIRVIKGSYHGIQVEFIDTPGLHAASSRQAENKALLKNIKKAYKWHKPNYLFYVDRLDAVRPGLGDLALLGLITEVLGAKVWRETMVVLTHAHACRAAMGAGYDMYSRQRRNIMLQLIRQAAGDMQSRNPIHVVDCHPQCPTNSFGQQVVLDNGTNVPWKQVLFMQLVGYRTYEVVQDLFKDKSKGKAATQKQADMFKQLMKPRLPPVSFFVEQMCEGVLKPETWGAMDDPLDQETDDEEAEEFQHLYYQNMYELAMEGHAGAQKEYAMMLKKLDRVRKTYKEAFQNEDLEMQVAGGYEGYVAEGLDLGPTFDPEDVTNHRYCYVVPEADWQIMPTLDYYGYEHEDAITGFVAEYDGQPFNRDGWGGFPMNVHLAVEKDKTSTCLQGESHVSIVHAVPPLSNRHITQLNGAFEILRPNLKDILYQLEINTFKDGFLARNDHAGVGLMVSRLGEGGKVTKGPMAMGVRLQDTFRVGPLKVEACASKVTAEAAQGGKDEAWGGRAFVRYDYLPGLGMIFDFYQQRTRETDDFEIGGMAANFSYDWQMLGAACGVEVDYVAGTNALHVDMNLFSCKDYRLAWVLLLPAWNYLKGMWARIRGGSGEIYEEEVQEEGGEEGGMPMDPNALAALMQQQGLAGLLGRGGM